MWRKRLSAGLDTGKVLQSSAKFFIVSCCGDLEPVKHQDTFSIESDQEFEYRKYHYGVMQTPFRLLHELFSSSPQDDGAGSRLGALLKSLTGSQSDVIYIIDCGRNCSSGRLHCSVQVLLLNLPRTGHVSVSEVLGGHVGDGQLTLRALRSILQQQDLLLHDSVNRKYHSLQTEQKVKFRQLSSKVSVITSLPTPPLLKQNSLIKVTHYCSLITLFIRIFVHFRIGTKS